jgi:hypothetical protein
MAGRIDITKSPEWVGAIAAMRVIDRSFAAAIRKYTKAMAEPEMRLAVRKRVRSRMQERVISSTTTVAVSSSNVKMRAGGKGRPLSGGLTMSQAAPPVEFGSNRYKQFGSRSRGGKVFYPAAKEMTPRLASLWVQTVMKTVAKALEGKGD